LSIYFVWVAQLSKCHFLEIKIQSLQHKPENRNPKSTLFKIRVH
jgi:hypothetical protein